MGSSGWAYPEWRGSFYPPKLPAKSYLAYCTARFDSIELNGTFYSLKTPATYSTWADTATAPGFVYAVKGSKLISHEKRLAGVEAPLANFYASGVLALADRTGPFLWQLPPQLAFDAGRVAAFLELLPKSAAEAEALARQHDARLDRGALVEAQAQMAYRHAFEVRHPSFADSAFRSLLERHGAALVIADTAGKYPVFEELTADFVYVRLHGGEVLYVSGYRDEELRGWADRIARWAEERDVYVYFDNTAAGHAPYDARTLRAMLGERGVTLATAAPSGPLGQLAHSLLR